MKKLFFIILLCLGLNELECFGKELCTLKFQVVANKIILIIPTAQNLNLNILYDSGSNEFLLDSLLTRKAGLTNDSTKTYQTNFLNGLVRSRFFLNKTFFKDTILNKLYKKGSSINLSEWSKRYGVHIDGLIGVNNYFKKYVIKIDFAKNTFVISDNSDNISETAHTAVLKMIYTNTDYESSKNSAFRKLSACSINFSVSNAHFITNAQFDTGFNKSFMLLTNLKIDSIMSLLNKPFIKTSKKTSLGNENDTLYEFLADSVLLDKHLIIGPVKIQMRNTSQVALDAFGSLNTAGLIGVEFFRRYKQVTFDYIGMQLILTDY